MARPTEGVCGEKHEASLRRLASNSCHVTASGLPWGRPPPARAAQSARGTETPRFQRCRPPFRSPRRSPRDADSLAASEVPREEAAASRSCREWRPRRLLHDLRPAVRRRLHVLVKNTRARRRPPPTTLRLGSQLYLALRDAPPALPVPSSSGHSPRVRGFPRRPPRACVLRSAFPLALLPRAAASD